MASSKLTQLSSSEFKFDSTSSFCLNSNGNSMILNNSTGVTTFELMYNCDSFLLMPYSIKQLRISQDKPISEIIRQVDLITIYENATVLESQEFACDIIYTSDCATEEIKARVLQADLLTINNKKMCCVLTNYGCCNFFEQDTVIGDWETTDIELTNILFTEVFPPKQPSPQIKTFNDVKKYTSKFLITSFKISENNAKIIIYLGTAAGYVVALKYNETSCRFEPYSYLKTSLNRISYLTTCNNFILAGCDRGSVVVLKIDFESNRLHELEYLWSITDGMSCQKALFTYSEEMSCYLVAFSKASHILVFRLDKQGAVECSSTLYVSGIKITGIESLTENEFVITTIAGAVKHMKISCPTAKELFCAEQSIGHDFDSSNYQIIGVAASASKHLWSFLLYRNKEYLNRLKFSATTAFINVCKLSSRDSFDTLTNSRLRNMDMAPDLVLSVGLNIFNNLDIDKYMEYLYLENLSIPDEINDIFLQRLQVKLIVTRNLSKYQLIKYKKLKEQTKTELQILEPALQLLHILQRMRYLKELNTKKIEFSKFQQESLRCMQLQFNQLLDQISNSTNDDETNSERCNVAEKFATYCRNKIKSLNFDTSGLCSAVELCTICNSRMENFKKCARKHDVKRCSVSCTQLSLFETKYCPHCYSLARSDEANLQELYAADECITCIYCRFLFKQDNMKFGIE